MQYDQYGTSLALCPNCQGEPGRVEGCERCAGIGYVSPGSIRPRNTRDNGKVEKLNNLPDVIAFCRQYGLPAYIVGRWVWLRFLEKPDKATRDFIKGAGFRWVKSRGEWAHSCGVPSRRGTHNPRWKYGSVPVNLVDENELQGVV